MQVNVCLCDLLMIDNYGSYMKQIQEGFIKEKYDCPLSMKLD